VREKVDEDEKGDKKGEGKKFRLCLVCM